MAWTSRFGGIMWERPESTGRGTRDGDDRRPFLGVLLETRAEKQVVPDGNVLMEGHNGGAGVLSLRAWRRGPRAGSADS